MDTFRHAYKTHQFLPQSLLLIFLGVFALTACNLSGDPGEELDDECQSDEECPDGSCIEGTARHSPIRPTPNSELDFQKVTKGDMWTQGGQAIIPHLRPAQELERAREGGYDHLCGKGK